MRLLSHARARRAALLALVAVAPLAIGVPCLVAQAVPQPPAQTRHEIIRGRVTTDSGKVIVGATIFATMAPDRTVFQAQSDSSGRYLIDVPGGTGDYLVHISSVGRKAFRKRVTRIGSDSVFVVDAALAPAVQQLAAVNVQAQRQKPTRGPGFGPETGAAEQTADGVVGAVSPDQAGDITALASTVPGVTTTPAGLSVLGLGAAQNQTTLNGMAFAGAEVPRDARVRTRVYTSSYDPARGGFGGAQIAVELGAGSSQFTFRRGHATLDAPALQSSDPVASRLGQRFTRVDLSLGADGPLGGDRWAYNVAGQLRRNVADATSLLDAPADVLRAAGVASDSVAHLVQLLHAGGVPVSVGGIPSDRQTDEMVFVGRLDHQPNKPGTFQPAEKTWGVTTYAKLSRAGALSFSPVATPAHGGQQRSGIGMVQGIHSMYFGPRKEYLNELRSALTYTENRSTPYLRLPDGRVLVSSLLDDGTSTTASLAFGGNSALDADTRLWTWETVNETQLYPPGQAKHKVKLYAQSRLDRGEQSLFANRLGSYAYNSLADLAADRPASFTRVLDSPTETGGEWSGALAVGDLWRKSPSFQMLYGARLEGNVYTDRPASNPTVERLFGARTDHAPNTIHASPRAGFTWKVGGGRSDGGGMTVSNLGTVYIAPKGIVRGGIGEFRNLLSPMLLADAAANTGLPGGARRLSCVGSAVPVPDWSAFAAGGAAIPDRCADGAPALADVAPQVQLFAPHYTAARSWRANLSWTADAKTLFSYTVEGAYSLNLDQPGNLDLNFAGVPRFALASEGDRPVYVSPASIVPATGALSPVEARRAADFGRVVSHVSDLRSVSRQLSLTVTPNLGFGRYFVRGSYTYGATRAVARGFDGTTFDDPRERAWTRGDLDARHQVQLQLGLSIKGISLTTYTRLASGFPYTPIVRGDINGDGLSNDRAFVFDPARSGDPGLAAGMRALLASAPAGVRDCLSRQLGRAAGRNSCEGPWSATMNAQLGISPALTEKLFRTRRASVSLNLANPLGGIDQLVHGSAHLHGWGAPVFPDAVLYTVRGFDPQTNQFRYDVNQRFGGTSPAQTTLRAPFRVTLDVRMDLGRPLGRQQLEKWLKPGRGGRPGVRLTVDSLKRRYARNVPDLYQGILQESDSLLLSPQQTEALQKAQAAFKQRMDSLWTDLATYLDGLSDDQVSGSAAFDRQETTVDRGWEMSRLEAQKVLPTILSPVQLKLIPWPAQMLYTQKVPFGPKVRIRIFSGG